MKFIKNNAVRIGADSFSRYSRGIDESRREITPLLEHLAVSPITAYRYECSSEWVLKKRTLPNSYWSYLVSGEGELAFGHCRKRVRAGQLVLFPARIEHSLTPVDGCCMSMVNVHFQARAYSSIDLCGLLGLEGAAPDVNGRFGWVSEELARLYALKPPGWWSYSESLIRALLFEVILSRGKKFELVAKELAKLSRIYPALELVEREFSDAGLSTGALASEIGISEVYTRKLFQQLFSLSPIKYIHQRRIDHACGLLRETEEPVKSIAMESGFNDLAFFYRIFVRVMEMTPVQYRQNPQF